MAVAVAPKPGEMVPGRGFTSAQWNDATRAAVAAWEAAHPGYKVDTTGQSPTGYMTDPTFNQPPSGGGTGGGGQVPQLPDLTTLIGQLTGAIPQPTLPTGASDPLSIAYLQAATQQGIAGLQQASALTQANQANQMKAWELMGANATGAPTDAATRWRQELAAQQEVQNATLQQRLLQMYGYDPDSPVGRTLMATTGGQTLEARTADAAQRARLAELMGYDPTTGQRTLGSQQLSQQQQQFLAQQAQQQSQFEATQAQQLAQLLGYTAGGQATLGRSQLDEQIRAALAQEANQQAQLSGYLANGQATLGRQQLTEQQRAAQAQEAQQLAQMLGYTSSGQSTLGQRQLEEQIRAATAGLTEQQRASMANEAARMAEITGYTAGGQSTLGQRQLESQAQQAELERQLRLQLQSGQLSQQESEFARTYLLQQDANRRAQTQLMGYDESGNLTEQGRAARAGEATQRAQIGAQLLGSPKDVFRAGQFFRQLQGYDPTGLGLGGQGISGFTTAAQNYAQGLPQTYNVGELYGAVGDTSNQNALGGGISTLTGTSGADAMQGAVGTAAAPTAPTAPTTETQATQANQSGGEDEQTPGTGPGGPVGMGAGGDLPGRKRPNTSRKLQVSPEQAIAQLIGRPSMGRTPDTTPDTKSKVQGTPYDPAIAKRAIDQLLATKKALAVPGMGPGGPVDAPTWPPDGSAPMPTLQDENSLGAPSAPDTAAAAAAPSTATGFNAAMPSGAGLSPSVLAQLTGGDPTTVPGRNVNDARLAAFGQQLLDVGTQGVGPQALERQSSTQRQLLDAALQASGLSLQDYLAAVAQGRFENTGNVNAA